MDEQKQMYRQKVNTAKKRIKHEANIYLVIIAFMLLIATTLAWFTVSSLAGVNSLEMTIGTGVELKVATENYGKDLEKYTHNITTEMIEQTLRKNYNATLQNMLLDPVTTKEGAKFYNQGGSQRDPNKDTYLEYDLYFISTEDMWVHLTTDESERGKNDGTSVTTTETGVKRDVVRCTRVSFTSESNEAAIYEPNKDTAVAGQTTFDLPAGSMTYSNGTRLFHLTALTPKKVTIRLWVEGEDPQCNDNVQSANLSVQLQFRGTDEENHIF